MHNKLLMNKLLIMSGLLIITMPMLSFAESAQSQEANQNLSQVTEKTSELAEASAPSQSPINTEVQAKIETSAKSKTPHNPHPHLEPITWKGEKWEYLVEHPTDIRHIDPVRMEELTDNAGQHGWKLTEVTSENSFYAFYFARPLHDHKLKAHRDRLNSIVARRKLREAELVKRIEEVHQEGLALREKTEALKAQELKEKQAEAIEKAYIASLKNQLHQRGLSSMNQRMLNRKLQDAILQERKLEAEEQTVEKEEVTLEKEIKADEALEKKEKTELAVLEAEDKP